MKPLGGMTQEEVERRLDLDSSGNTYISDAEARVMFFFLVGYLGRGHEAVLDAFGLVYGQPRKDKWGIPC